MGNRLSKIATRTGDDGTTGLGDGSRTTKDALRVQAMGDVDELNSHLGLLLCEDVPDDLREELVTIQHDLFDLGGELCIPGFSLITDTHVIRLDTLLANTTPLCPCWRNSSCLRDRALHRKLMFAVLFAGVPNGRLSLLVTPRH
jgi:cob(I)alamin adenosyltransferase